MRLDARIDGERVFGEDAQGYDAGRLSYPDRVDEILSERCGIAQIRRSFEIGAGSGIATRQVLRLGVQEISAIEPDRRLAAYLVDSLVDRAERVEVQINSFEDVELPIGSFDLGIAATSFHWLEPTVALAKVAKLLRPGGWWAMWWNLYRSPEGLDAFSKSISHLYEKFQISSSDDSVMPFGLEVGQRLKEIEGAGLVDSQFELICWNVKMSAQRTRALYSTFSPIRKLHLEDQTAFLDALERIAANEFNGEIERTFMTPIYTAQSA